MLDYVENFILFTGSKGRLVKIIAQNHQFLGVNNAIAATLEARRRGHGRAGVFWQTQGSGKSYAMAFYSQKIQRKHPGDWTFVIVTDRTDLDAQIADTFKAAGVVSEAEGDQCHAGSGAQLAQLLRGNHRYVFTLIQKFRIPELLCDRTDVVVITDEAHRSQYDTLALNMRTPELQLVNPDLNDDIYAVIEAADLDGEEEQKLERELGRQYHIITRDDRLETIARDIVRHFLGRGFMGKAIAISISIDKATTLRPMRNHTNIDLSKIDFQALADKFKQKKHKKTELEELKALIAAHLARMVQLNPIRADFRETFEALIVSYNAGSRSVEEVYAQLLQLSQQLSQEQQRHIRENLSEEELAVFDILLQSAPDLSDSDRAKVKQSARELVERIKPRLVLNWQQKFDARAKLKVVIEDALDLGLPRAYTTELYRQKCEVIFSHIEQAYPERDRSVYADC